MEEYTLTDYQLFFSWRSGLSTRHTVAASAESVVHQSKGMFSESRKEFWVADLDPAYSITTRRDYRILAACLIALSIGSYWLYLAVLGEEAKESLAARVALGIVAMLLLAAGAGLAERYIDSSGKFYIIGYRYTGVEAIIVAKLQSTEEGMGRLVRHITTHGFEHSASNESVAEQLSRIVSLYDAGYLSPEEFRIAKERVLGIYE